MSIDVSDLRTKAVPPTNREPKHNKDCCVACNRVLKFSSSTPMKMVQMVEDKTMVLHRGDLGKYPFEDSWFEYIGPECARKFGPDYILTEGEGMYFVDHSFGRPATLGPVTQAEIDYIKLTDAEVTEINRMLDLGEDLADYWRRDLENASSPRP